MKPRNRAAVVAALAGAALSVSERLPIPPIPPAMPPPSELAPIPDVDARAPAGASRQGIAVAPELFEPPNLYRGDGYAPGSTVQPVQERGLRPAAGVKLLVPLN